MNEYIPITYGFKYSQQIRHTMELMITPAVVHVMEMYDLILKANLYQEPPIHKVIKCQELKNKKQN